MANRYYTSFPLAPGEVILQGPEARHLATVMRASPGDAVCLFNGDGCEYPATVIAVSKRDVTLIIEAVERPSRELSFQLEIAAAVPKGDREEFLLEKLTELGVTRFVPLITERAVVVPKVERLRRTVIEASKQCGRNVLMEVAEVVRFEEYLATTAAATRWLAHVGSGSLPPCWGGLGWEDSGSLPHKGGGRKGAEPCHGFSAVAAWWYHCCHWPGRWIHNQRS